MLEVFYILSFSCTAVFTNEDWRGNVSCCGPRCEVWYGVWPATSC